MPAEDSQEHGPNWGHENNKLLRQLITIAEALMATIQDLITKVASESTVDDSIITLLNGISQQLKDALAAGGSPAQIQAVSDALDANIAKIQAAVTANTPVAPTP